MIYAGVDIAKTDHVIGAVDERGAEVCRPLPFKNTEAGLERAVAWLEGLAGSPSDVVVGMEATGRSWMECYSFLVARGYSVAVINPMQVKAVRKLKGLDKVKNDRVDAGLIAEALRIGRYDETRLATDEVASLRSLSRYLQSLRGMVAELKTQCVCLMDARSIAATARNGGRITPADELDYTPERHPYQFDKTVYARRVYNGFGHPQPETTLIMGPNIPDWPRMYELGEHLLLELAAVIHDPVTTTDELIPSGETSSYRSNPLRLAEFTLSRRVPDYVPRAKEIAAKEAERREGSNPSDILAALSRVGDAEALLNTTQFGSCVFANKPGDGSAREQAASCQKVLGGLANICYEFATKRYRSNCINWGMLPFTLDEGTPFDYTPGDLVFVPDVRKRLEKGCEDFPAEVLRQTGEKAELLLHVKGLTPDERDILLDGCLMNYYAKRG